MFNITFIQWSLPSWSVVIASLSRLYSLSPMSLVAFTRNWYEVKGFNLQIQKESIKCILCTTAPHSFVFKCEVNKYATRLPVDYVGVCLMADRSRVDRPVTVWKLPVLDCIVTNRRQSVTAWFPWQQHSASLDLLLRHGGTTSWLRSGWRTNTLLNMKSQMSP